MHLRQPAPAAPTAAAALGIVELRAVVQRIEHLGRPAQGVILEPDHTAVGIALREHIAPRVIAVRSGVSRGIQFRHQVAPAVVYVPISRRPQRRVRHRHKTTVAVKKWLLSLLVQKWLLSLLVPLRHYSSESRGISGISLHLVCASHSFSRAKEELGSESHAL